MQVKLADSAGFCFGVKRAVTTVYDEAEKNKGSVYTYGPIIHNETVVADLKKKGVMVIDETTDLDTLAGATVIIRSHGVGQKTYETLKEKGCHVVDATCPFVKKIHNTVSEASQKGAHIVIIGNSAHPEVQGICGWCKSEAIVVGNAKEASDLLVSDGKPVCVVAQTTFNYKKFQELVEIIMKKEYNVNVVNTICNATSVRQTEARTIAAGVDVMLVVGDKHSSNTQKLYEICKEECKATYYIQTLVDLDSSRLQSVGSIGITAGASTPNNIIEEVYTHVRKL
jgi:4-hydroxy-3-methylbut-2-enyl diphosphate reductase